MSARKKSMLIYYDNYPILASLSMEQRGLLFTALMVYGDRLSRDSGTELEAVLEQFPQLTPEARLVCGFMAGNILRDTEKWLSRQQYRSKQKTPVQTPAAEKRTREDMERTRRLMERLKEE